MLSSEELDIPLPTFRSKCECLLKWDEYVTNLKYSFLHKRKCMLDINYFVSKRVYFEKN